MNGQPALGLQVGVRTTVALLLLTLVSLAFPLEAGHPRHVHKVGSAGLFNEEHVLASLDSLSGDLPLPDAGAGAFVALVATACLLARGARPSTPAPTLSDSRAPPLA